jgi:voltage-gated potassium channel Kch
MIAHAQHLRIGLHTAAEQTVLVGYGRVGRRIGEALIANDVSNVMVEGNREIVKVMRDFRT